MIRNLIFDMGGVLIAWDPPRMVERLALPEEDGRLLRREVFGSVEWVRLDRGSLSEQEALERFRRRLPERLYAAAERCVFWWREPLWPVPGMAELIRELDGLGYGIYLLSNATSALHEYFPRIPGSEYFQGGIVSADWKLLKPQREIYEKLFAEWGLRAEDCLFIDDNPSNVEAACLCGMDGLAFYQDMEKLRSDLRSKGVRVREGEA
ncbi:MAG: HAD family phosphatase [Oscillospiraceae bacterium]|nr:HAD family phosphatase [Oscillospiraceae bacterium]